MFIWFADYHSFIPVFFARLTGRKSFVVIGGYEVCRIKSLHYGALCSRFRACFCVKSMQWCTLNLSVSTYIDRKVKSIAPGSKRQLIPNCVNISKAEIQIGEKENMAITVGLIENQRSFLLKGIDTFIEVARQTPDLQFVIIGIDKTKLADLLTDIPANLVLIGKMNHEELPPYYAKAKYYCQLSRSESFGVSIAEAMFHGCIPVVTHEGGMPELVGPTGFVVERNVEKISGILRRKVNPEMQQQAAHRVINAFSRDKRKSMLLTAIAKTKNN